MNLASTSYGALVCAVVFAAACGGNVSLGSTGSSHDSDGGVTSEAGSHPSNGQGVDAATGVVVDCSDANLCGPAPKSPAVQCADGSLGGNTGRCIPAGQACVWENRECPTEPPSACFDEHREPQYQHAEICQTDADCVVVGYLKDCCGSRRVTGVLATKKQVFEACAASVESGAICDCAPRPTLADDGTIEPTGGAIPKVRCITDANRSNFCSSTYFAGG